MSSTTLYRVTHLNFSSLQLLTYFFVSQTTKYSIQKHNAKHYTTFCFQIVNLFLCFGVIEVSLFVGDPVV